MNNFILYNSNWYWGDRKWGDRKWGDGKWMLQYCSIKRYIAM